VIVTFGYCLCQPLIMDVAMVSFESPYNPCTRSSISLISAALHLFSYFGQVWYKPGCDKLFECAVTLHIPSQTRSGLEAADLTLKKEQIPVLIAGMVFHFSIPN
jgi:hypothetical protein